MPNRRQDIIWTYADPINWRMHVLQGGNQLTKLRQDEHKCFLSAQMCFANKISIYRQMLCNIPMSSW